MERTFVKCDTDTMQLLSMGSLSPIVKDYVYDSSVPKPCRYFCGRDKELAIKRKSPLSQPLRSPKSISRNGRQGYIKKCTELLMPIFPRRVAYIYYVSYFSKI